MGQQSSIWGNKAPHGATKLHMGQQSSMQLRPMWPSPTQLRPMRLGSMQLRPMRPSPMQLGPCSWTPCSWTPCGKAPCTRSHTIRLPSSMESLAAPPPATPHTCHALPLPRRTPVMPYPCRATQIVPPSFPPTNTARSQCASSRPPVSV
eukprot:350824-Chlamydomonas_euryale.AAC.3